MEESTGYDLHFADSSFFHCLRRREFLTSSRFLVNFSRYANICQSLGWRAVIDSAVRSGGPGSRAGGKCRRRVEKDPGVV